MKNITLAISGNTYRQARVWAATAVPQLLHTGSTALKWHFPKENATCYGASQDICIVEPLETRPIGLRRRSEASRKSARQVAHAVRFRG